jgi:hypothetical protein
MTSFQSRNTPNQWPCHGFKNLKVQPTHYSISSHNNIYCLRSWVLERSSDGSKWNELDRHENDSTINKEHTIGTFSISVRNKYQYLRVRQTGKNGGGNDYLTIHAFEVFGRLIE